MISDSDTISLIAADGVDPSERRCYAAVVLSSERPFEQPTRHALVGATTVVLGRGTTRIARPDGAEMQLLVDDASVSRRQALIQRRGARWELTDLGSKNGTRLDGATFTTEMPLAHGAVIEIGRSFLVYWEARARRGEPLDDCADEALPAGLSTLDPGLVGRFTELIRLIRADAVALLAGETGTGKEVVARAIHAELRRPGELVAVNCGALPDSLVESELFGHKRGAFSGATGDRVGLIQAAHGGTLFLDEIGDLPAAAQATLLRVLQEREVTPLGATRAIPVDLRVIAASHRDLGAMVEAGTFRKDLLARLAGCVCTLPPLRERRIDLGLLIASILRALAGDAASSITIDRDAARALFGYRWPLNIRELVTVLRGALALGDGGTIALRHLGEAVTSPEPPPSSSSLDDAPGSPDLDARRKAELIALLRTHAGNVAAVARALGRQRTLIHRWLRAYGVDPDAYRR